MLCRQSKFVLKKIGANLDEEHQVFYLSYLIQIFKQLHPEYFKEKKLGCNKKHKLEELLGLTTWGHWNNHESCRQLAQLCKNNDESVQVLISTQPSKSTVNDFTNDEAELIRAFDDFIVEFCTIVGLVGGTEFNADGTFVDAYSNYFKALYPDEIDYLLEFIYRLRSNTQEYNLLHSYYIENEEATEEFEMLYQELRNNLNIHGINLIIKALEDDDNYWEVIFKLWDMKKNITKDEVKVSIVDPEAHLMQDKSHQWGFHYNYQQTTDNKYGIIVDHYITQNPNDKKEIRKLIDRLIDKFGDNGFSLAVDYGYWNIKLLIDIIRQTNAIPVIPDKASATYTKEKISKQNQSYKRYEQKQKKKKENKKQRTFIEREEFIYHEDKDAYECPKTNNLLEFQKIKENTEGIQYRQYYTPKCKTCKYHDLCTSQPQRTIQSINEPEIQQIQEHYQSDKGQKTYKNRGPQSEGNFADLFEARNWRGLKVRGTKNADHQLTRNVIIHNAKKIQKHMNIKVLKKTLKHITQQKEQHKSTKDILQELKGKFIEKNDQIIDINI